MNIRHLAILSIAFILGACNAERITYQGDNFVMFASDSHTFGVLDENEWFEIPISATRTSSKDRTIGVEVLIAQSSAIEDMHYVLESHSVTINAGELTTAARIKGIPEAITPNAPVEVRLNLVLDSEDINTEYGTETSVVLQRCCPFDINNFSGYAVLTSTWCMQYMNVESCLVHTHADPNQEGVIVIEDMFYEGYDIRIKLENEDRLTPIATLCGPQVLGSTGEAFGTIYGNGKLMVDATTGSLSYYSPCENFVLLYTTMYVEEVGTVGNYVNIFEWISDEEAERIMREGF